LGPNDPLSNQFLDWGSYQAYAAEYPGAAAAGSPAYLPAVDTGDEWAAKIGGQYQLGLVFRSPTCGGDAPNIPSSWRFRTSASAPVTGYTRLCLQRQPRSGRPRWAHAGASVGDPGGQHNYNPYGIGQNQANMYTFGWWHKLDKQLTAYLTLPTR
jgi:hypothetical protein